MCYESYENVEFRLGEIEYLPVSEFEELKVIGEDVDPIELVTTDPVTQAVLNELNLSAEETLDLSMSVESIKVTAIKPG